MERILRGNRGYTEEQREEGRGRINLVRGCGGVNTGIHSRKEGSKDEVR